MDVINRLYTTINHENNFTNYLNTYNKNLLNTKLYPDDKDMIDIFATNKSNLDNILTKLKQILTSLNTSIKDKDKYLHDSNIIMDDQKKLNKHLKDIYKSLKNTNSGAVGMYEDLKYLYNYTLIEYILIIMGIVGLVYNMKK